MPLVMPLYTYYYLSVFIIYIIMQSPRPSTSTTTQEVGSTEKERIYILNEEGVLEDYVPSPAVFETEVENTQSFSSVATPSLPGKEKKRKHRRSGNDIHNNSQACT